jgi:cobalt-zinc-cadmium efflux system membrane fusion protein
VDKLSEDQAIRYLRLFGLPDNIRKRVDAETLTANLLPLKAPFDGRVVDRRVAPGEVVNTSRPHILFAVGDVSLLHIEMQVRLDDAARLRLGQKVFFVPENARSAAAVGTLSSLSPEVDEKTRYVRSHAHAPNPDDKLRPHTYGTARILVAEHPRAVAVPSGAVQSLPDAAGKSDQQTYRVFVRVSETVYEARPVQPGLQADGFTEVSGVRPGEQVVTAGSHALKSELLKERIGGGDD